MTTYPGSPKLLKGGIVLVDAASSAVQGIIALQYNPETLSRTLQVKSVNAEGGGDRSQATRLTGPAVETISLEAEIDAADQMEVAEPTTIDAGIHPQLAQLESLIHPTSGQLSANNRLAGSGTLEIAPMEAPLTLFIWSKHRILPVAITEFSVTEEAFDPNLNPIRAKVSLGMRVLSVDDLGFAHQGGSLFMSYLQNKEALAKRVPRAAFGTLGIGGVP